MIANKQKLTTKELVNVIKKAPVGSKFCFHIKFQIVVAENDDEHYGAAGSTYIVLSRKEAMRVAGSILSKSLEEKGGRVRMSAEVKERWNRRKQCTTSLTEYWIG